MRDVAALAGVGVMTVSRVVNGRGGVGPERAARVRQAIEKLNYRHNVTARHLRLTGQSTATIGVLLEDVANPFAAELLRAVENVMSKQGCLVLCASSDRDAAREKALLSAFCARRVDGLIIVPSGPDHRYLLPEVRRGTQVVFADRPATTVAADAVVSDNLGGARLAVTHLLAGGHTRIGFLSDLRQIYTAAERYRGYTEALGAAGIEPDERLIRRDIHSAGSAERATLELLASPAAPTAIFTAQNLLTVGARMALRSMGAERAIAHVGFDDIPLAELVDPGITVIAQDPPALGTLAAQMLLQRIRDPEGAPEAVEVPTRLLTRGSGEIPPSGHDGHRRG
ncbi:MAG: LacI family DNA-binding transcriptional regulator [Streptosporangiaceae bacterium]|nr:LacI family DNA-binding transcriptional regulator [Streptosporangiaceae bacterium]MBV9856302.1 LacI family DNA-binding transcriptional regulator [Streptosporangiaceae bacterium]